MDSINKSQTEYNHEDLSGSAAVERIRQLVEKAGSCFFTTAVAGNGSCSTRPMGAQKVDDEGNIWFLSANNSHKNQEIAVDPRVTLYFQGSPDSDFLVLKGIAAAIRDENKIHELWQPMFETWFYEGENDPHISVIRVTPTEGHYWDTKQGFATAGIKMIVGAVLSKIQDDSMEGKITL